MSDLIKALQDLYGRMDEAASESTWNKKRQIQGDMEIIEDAISQLQASDWDNEAKEIIKAVAHIGIDWGFGKYELEDKFIDMARKLYEADQGIQNPTITPPKEEE